MGYEPTLDAAGRLQQCIRCGATAYDGPRALVLTLVFAQERLLLIQRGEAPYAGQWAPPGGYVEHRESFESAAVREIEEEAGILLRPEAMIPHALVSLPGLNQVYAMYIACLEEMLPVRAKGPESLDARWVEEDQLADLPLWDPAVGYDMGWLYRRAKSGRFEFYQQTGTFIRKFANNRMGYFRPCRRDGSS